MRNSIYYFYNTTKQSYDNQWTNNYTPITNVKVCPEFK